MLLLKSLDRQNFGPRTYTLLWSHHITKVLLLWLFWATWACDAMTCWVTSDHKWYHILNLYIYFCFKFWCVHNFRSLLFFRCCFGCCCWQALVNRLKFTRVSKIVCPCECISIFISSFFFSFFKYLISDKK